MRPTRLSVAHLKTLRTSIGPSLYGEEARKGITLCPRPENQNLVNQGSRTHSVNKIVYSISVITRGARNLHAGGNRTEPYSYRALRVT